MSLCIKGKVTANLVKFEKIHVVQVQLVVSDDPAQPAHPLLDSHSKRELNVCRMWGVRTRVQVSKNEHYTQT